MSPQISELKRGCGRLITGPARLSGGALFCSHQCAGVLEHRRYGGVLPFFNYPDSARCGDRLSDARKREMRTK